MADKIQKTDDEWRSELTPEQYHILREKGTELPFTGKLLHNDKTGMYKCAACGAELLSFSRHLPKSRQVSSSTSHHHARGVIHFLSETSDHIQGDRRGRIKA